VIDVEAEPQAKPFPDLVAEGAIEHATKRDLKVVTQPIDWEAVENDNPEPVYREQFTPDEVARIRKMIAEPEVTETQPKKHWWQRG